MPNKNLSEEARWFLRSVQKIQDDFAEALGVVMGLFDKNGHEVTKMSGLTEACKMIRSTPKGLEGCNKEHQAAMTLFSAGKLKELYLSECWAGFIGLAVPIFVKGKFVGAVGGCGSLFKADISKDELREKYRKFAKEIEIKDVDGFAQTVIGGKFLSKEEVRARMIRLKKLIEVLAEETALSEVFKL